ncbi:MAG: zf-HC2 domain-containing protein [Acidobacteriota bacterium]
MDCGKFEELIEGYLAGILPEEEREPFEEHYFICDNCFTSLKISESIYKKKITIVTSGRRAPSLIFKPAMIFASFLLIAFSSFLYINHKKDLGDLKKITAFEIPAFIKNETRNHINNDKFYSAMEYYNRGDYKSALKHLKSTPTETPRTLFFKGIILLINNKPGDAVKNFDSIIKDMDPSYYDEALFYKSIALLRMNKKKEALKELKSLQNMFSPFSERAEKLIEKVKNLK